MKHEQLKTKMAAGLSTLALAAGGMLLFGCTEAEPPPVEPITQAPPPPPEPQLTTAGDAHVTLFGETPEQQSVPYKPTTALPMKQHSFSTEGADFDVDVSPDGKLLAFASTRNSVQPDIYLKTLDGRAVTLLTSDPAPDVQPCFSPDGQTIAFASRRSGNWDLWMVSIQGGQATQITHSPMQEVHPSFAPDGQRLAYCLFNSRAEQWELWILQLNQPGSARMVGVGLFPQWSPVGDSLVYQRARQRGGRWFSIWRLDLEMGEPKFPIELASSSEMALIQPNWSPDGESVTYGTALMGTGDALNGPTTTRGDVWIMRADGSSPRQLTGGGANFGPVWSIEQRVYFTSKENGTENLWSVKPGTAVGETPLARAQTIEPETVTPAAAVGRMGSHAQSPSVGPEQSLVEKPIAPAVRESATTSQ